MIAGPLLPRPLLFHRIWPVAGIALGLIATVAWTAGYGLIELIEMAL
jgi:hypothetical protein